MNGAVDNVREDFELAVRVRRKSTSLRDSVFVDHIQRTPVLLARDLGIVVGEVERL